MLDIKVRNMRSTRGNQVPNQFIINVDDKKIFKSYDSNIVIVNYSDDTIIFGSDWKYSNTTSKYRTLFLSELGIHATTTEIQDAINNNGSLGRYKVLYSEDV